MGAISAVLVGMGGIGYALGSRSVFSALNYASAGLVALLLYLHFMVTLSVRHCWAAFDGTAPGAVIAALLGTALYHRSDISGRATGNSVGRGRRSALFDLHPGFGSRVLI